MSNTVSTTVNRCVDVSLTTHAGTGYIWALTSMSGGIALVEQQDVASARNAGGAVRQVFTFVGTAASKGALTFSLIRPWEADQAVDTASFDVVVEDAGAEDKLEKAAGAGAFVSTYLAAPAVAACDGSGNVLMESGANCNLKYGIPPNQGAENCVMKYAIPIRPMYAISPPTGGGVGGPVMFYAVPAPNKKG